MFDGLDQKSFTLFSAAPNAGNKEADARLAAAGFSVGAHLAVLAVLMMLRFAIPPPDPQGVTTVTHLVAPPAPLATRPEADANVVRVPPAEIQVGDFDSSIGPLTASLGNAPDSPVVVGTWITVIPTAQIAPASGGFAASGLFGLSAPGSRTQTEPELEFAAGTASGTVIQDAARLLSSPSPDYTEEARQLHITGEVVLEVRVTASGHAQFLRLVHGLGHGLDEVAIETVRDLLFSPARRGGVPVEALTKVTLIFRLT